MWHLPTLPGLIQVPSAVRGLTSLFGMGRGEHLRYNHHCHIGNKFIWRLSLYVNTIPIYTYSTTYYSDTISLLIIIKVERETKIL